MIIIRQILNKNDYLRVDNSNLDLRTASGQIFGKSCSPVSVFCSKVLVLRVVQQPLLLSILFAYF